MKGKTTNLRQMNISGNGDLSSNRESLTAMLTQWRQKLGYYSIFATIPAMLVSHVPGARADNAKKPEVSVAGRTTTLLERLNKSSSTPALLKRQSKFRLPHQKSSFDMVAALGGNDDCPGRTIAGGNYTAAAPYTDSGDTTGANDTVTRLISGYYYYYSYDANGPDHVYSFTLTGRGPNPQIEVSTTSGTYRPLIYVLQGGYDGACPAGAGNLGYNMVVLSDSRGTTGSTATLNIDQVNNLPLNVPLHLFVDSALNDASGSGPYSIRMQDVTIAGPTPGPNSVQFSSAGYSVSEGSPRADITLTRSGDTSGAASVSFATNDGAGLQNCDMVNGMASPRCDYENTIGTVQFAAGETSKSFSVAVVDDSYAEGNETFTINLTGASGTTLDSQSSATVMIADNDATNGVPPIDDTNFFVRQQYIDFLGREPDPPGFDGWVSTINTCSGDTTQCDRVHVSEAFFRSPEFQQRGYFTYRFYSVAFGRKPDYAEFVPDLARVSGFLPDVELEAAKVAFIADFMARPGFANTYNGLNNVQFVDTLLNTANVTLSSRQSMIDRLNAGTASRAQVLRQIVESGEVSAKFFNQSFAVMEYFGYLRRDPDALYLNWIDVLDQGGDSRGMVDGFVNSTEYRLRFGP
jgi:hypothetical protein